MEEYLHYMKTLRTHMNDVEDQAAKISVEEQMQITTIHTLEIDLNSVVIPEQGGLNYNWTHVNLLDVVLRRSICYDGLAKCETKRLTEETEQMVKSRGDMCSKILEKQKKVMTLESDSFNLSQVVAFCLSLQTLELIQQERSNFAAKVVEKSSYYAKVSEDMITKLQEQKISEGDDMQTDATDEMPSNGCNVASSLGDEAMEEVLARLHAAEAKLREITQLRTRLVAENSEPELSAMEMITLEEEHKAILSEKDGEAEYMQSLQSQLEKLRGISHKVKCACGEEFKIQM
ncbi:hypothetical protein KSS87_004743 [Heliosperma pusillum]|nr:hypothetical protein KSS87_004743 [Heliosperma pusillum]